MNPNDDGWDVWRSRNSCILKSGTAQTVREAAIIRTRNSHILKEVMTWYRNCCFLGGGNP